MSSKHFLTSKTVWTAVGVIAYSLLKHMGIDHEPVTQFDESTALALYAVGSIVLRFVTNRPVHVS